MRDLPRPIRTFGELCSAAQGAYWLWGLIGFTGASVLAAVTAFLDAPIWAIFLAVVAGCLIGLGILISLQNWKASSYRADIADTQSLARSEDEEIARVAWGTEQVPMPDAAMQLYHASRPIRMQWEEQLAKINEMDKDAERNAMLDYVAKEIAKKCSIFGKHMQSVKIRRINIKDSESLVFRDGGRTFYHWLYDRSPEYTDITIQRACLDDLLQHARNNG